MKFASLCIAVPVALAASAGLAQQPTLTGADAFGDYRSDAPGVTRLITPADLPAPSLDRSSANAARVVPMPPGALPKVPEGFTVEMIDRGIANPRTLEVAPNGDLFVANSAAGEILVYALSRGQRERAVFADGLNAPYGLAFHPPGDDPEWLYVGVADGLVRFAYTAGAVAAGGPAERLVGGIPTSGHWTRSIAFSPDGSRLYYAIGSASNAGEAMGAEPPGGLDAWIAEQPLGVAWGGERYRASVLSMAPDGSDAKVAATGLRNCSGLTVQPATGDPWCVVNERDQLGDDLPPDFAARVSEGRFFGWPWYYIGAHPDPRWARAPRVDLADKVTVPEVLFQAHSAPLNIRFYGDGPFGPDYRGDGFVAMHGSWNRANRTGYKVVRLPFDEAGRATGSYQDFMTGFVTGDGDVWGRPVGLAIGPDGALYVSEDGNGSIWRVRAD